MGLRTPPDCRSDVPGLLAAGLAQAGCANHFAGFHIGLAVGNGWIAGRSAVEDLDRLPVPKPDVRLLEDLYAETMLPLSGDAKAQSDLLLRELQKVMFAWDVGILKREDRLDQAMVKVAELETQMQDLHAPNAHELVRMKETEAMLTAARFILGASRMRTESRLSHFREDYDQRDDQNWLDWIDITDTPDGPSFVRTKIPTPLCPVLPVQRKKREVNNAVVTPG
jgi:succinate dehydrogenase/fumarate reductase flavoprotein subunit